MVLTGYVAALTLRAAYWQSPHHFHWLLPLDALLPAGATLAVNVVLYASLLWLCVVFPRALQGKERVLVAGCAGCPAESHSGDGVGMARCCHSICQGGQHNGRVLRCRGNPPGRLGKRQRSV